MQDLTGVGLQGKIEQVVGATLGAQDPVVADSASTEQEAAGEVLGGVVGDVSKDVKVTAHCHALAHTDPHGHPRLLFISQLVQVVGSPEGFPLLWGPCGDRKESFFMAGTYSSKRETGARQAGFSW